MRPRFQLFRRGTTYYSEDTVTGRQLSLRTKHRDIAARLIHAKNEAALHPAINLQIARAYLTAADPKIAARTWQEVMEAMSETKRGVTLDRWQRAIKDEAFDSIRRMPVIETKPEHLHRVLREGRVSTNVFLRRIHNFALDMTWLPWPVIVKVKWPKIIFGEKRAITLAEHLRIVGQETNPERKAFYQLAWHLGASQSDVASLEATNILWENSVLTFRRRKSKVTALLKFSEDCAAVLRSRPSEGPLFPYLRTLGESDRATEFKRQCRRVGVVGVTLHSYRYAWAERAKTAGYPERFAQEALGHNSKAVHRAYARHATVELPALDDYERMRLPVTPPSQPGKDLAG